MSQYALRLPNSLMDQVKKLSRQDRVSMNQFMLSAIAEKASAVATEEYFKSRAARANRAKARAVLQKIQHRGNPPLPGDELPASVPRVGRTAPRPTRRAGRGKRGQTPFPLPKEARATVERLRAANIPPMSEEEIQAEIDAVRAERRAARKRANRP